MIRVEDWQIALKMRCLRWLARFHCCHRCEGLACRLLSRHEGAGTVCPWEALTIWDSLSVTLFSIPNLCVVPTHPSRFKCTRLWSTFPIIPFMCNTPFLSCTCLFIAFKGDIFLFVFTPDSHHCKLHEGRQPCPVCLFVCLAYLFIFSYERIQFIFEYNKLHYLCFICMNYGLLPLEQIIANWLHVHMYSL